MRTQSISLSFLVACVALTVACTTRYQLTEVQRFVGGAEILCAGGAYAEPVTLHGSISNGAADTWIWLETSGRRVDVVWPRGYSADFRPTLVVFDSDGQIVAREGLRVQAGCPMPNGELLELPG